MCALGYKYLGFSAVLTEIWPRRGSTSSFEFGKHSRIPVGKKVLQNQITREERGHFMNLSEKRHSQSFHGTSKSGGGPGVSPVPGGCPLCPGLWREHADVPGLPWERDGPAVARERGAGFFPEPRGRALSLRLRFLRPERRAVHTGPDSRPPGGGTSERGLGTPGGGRPSGKALEASRSPCWRSHLGAAAGGHGDRGCHGRDAVGVRSPHCGPLLDRPGCRRGASG